MGAFSSAFGQSPEEIHRLVCRSGTAPTDRRSIRRYAKAIMPPVLGYNQPGEGRAFCYQYGGETKSGPLPSGGEGIWRCLALSKLSMVEVLLGPWRTDPMVLNVV
jgi:hypothetical protein